MSFEKFTSSKLFEFFESLWLIFIINVLTLVCCFGIVTILPALIAASASLKEIKNPKLKVYRYYFQKFKEHFQQSAFLNIVLLMIGAVIGIGIGYYITSSKDWFNNMGFYAMVFFGIIFIAVIIYLPLVFLNMPELSSYEKIIFSFEFSLSNIFNTILLLIILFCEILFMLLPIGLSLFILLGISSFYYFVILLSEVKMLKNRKKYLENIGGNDE